MRFSIMLVLLLTMSELGSAQKIWHVPGDFSTIQDAMVGSSHGDTIMVRPGTYKENVDFLGKAVTLMSDHGPDFTVIDGKQLSSVVVFQSGEQLDSVLDGFTITNGVGTLWDSKKRGGGIYCNASSPTIRNNRIEGNEVIDVSTGGGIWCLDSCLVIEGNTIQENNACRGAGIYCRESSPVIVGNTVSANKAYYGGGIDCVLCPVATVSNNVITDNIGYDKGGGVRLYGVISGTFTGNTIMKNTTGGTGRGGGINCGDDTGLIISNNIISHNSAPGGMAYGGGIAIEDGFPIIENNAIENNMAGKRGGGIYVYGPDKIVIVRNNLIKGNWVTDYMGAGGGVNCYSNSWAALFEENTIMENDAYFGGGFSCYDAIPEIKNNVISGNTAVYSGGICCDYHSNATITDNLISLNSATDEGGVSCTFGSEALIEGNIISQNTADRTAGLYSRLSDAVIRNNLIIENNATHGGPGGMLISECNPVIENNIITKNSALSHGGGIYSHNANPLIKNNTITYNTVTKNDGMGGGIHSSAYAYTKITNTILWGNSASSGPQICVGYASHTSTVAISYSDVEGGPNAVHVHSGSTLDWGSGMIDAAPHFVDGGDSDFHLKHTSPCKDTGDNVVVTGSHDFEGDPRIVNGTVDMGADEFHPHLYHTGEATPSGNIDLKFIGLPDTLVNGLMIGVNIIEPPLPCDYGLWYMDHPFQVVTGFGSIPPEGILSFPGSVPASMPVPLTLYLQAAIDCSLTNLCTLDVE